MDWMQILVIMLAIIVAVLLIVITAIALTLYRVAKRAQSISDHLDHTAANFEKFSSNAASMAGGGVMAKFASKAFETWIKSKVNTKSDGKKTSRKKSR